MISLGAPKINFQCDNPAGFDQLLAAVEKHVTEDVDGERPSDSSTPGGTEINQLAFQVSFPYHWKFASISLMHECES